MLFRQFLVILSVPLVLGLTGCGGGGVIPARDGGAARV